ncbi:glycosyl transferase [Clostridium polyendosporum]|uniref:Glycosyl transferase n=1 Tax=Clostridium polyendosporum TaxID=69208 RepID=A0A919VK80_9CLOT|nr:glycosyltransferase [Clostridium polyendosporum]GIM27378.1 glycosyl transferase [Clostridium polyendosporum]
MKILQVNTRYIGGGGAASIANSLHEYINKNTEHESIFLYGRGEHGDENSIRIGKNIDTYLSALMNRALGKPYNLYFNNKIEEYIKNFDVIHFHNLHGYYINYEKLLKLVVKYDKPIIWTLHDQWTFTGGCAFPGKCNKWRDKCFSCEQKQLYPKRYIDRSKSTWGSKRNILNLLNKEKTIFISPSQWLADEFKKSYLKDYRINVIPNGIDNNSNLQIDKVEQRKMLGIPIDKKIVLFVAADPNDGRKGIEYLFDVITDFSEDIIFISVGKEIKDINYKNLIQLGYIRHKEKINSIYAIADVFLSTAIEDNFPTTILEAMSNRLPIVAFDVGGVREQIGEMCGVMINKGNSNMLKNEIIKLLKNDAKIEELSINSYKKYSSNYTLECFAEKYVNCYTELI